MGTARKYNSRSCDGSCETLHATQQRIWWQGVSMAHAGQAEKRLEKVLAWRGAVNVGTKKYTAILIIAFAIPVAFLAASARPVRQEQSFPKPDSASNQVSPAPAGSHLEPPPPSSQAPASPSLPP